MCEREPFGTLPTTLSHVDAKKDENKENKPIYDSILKSYTNVAGRPSAKINFDEVMICADHGWSIRTTALFLGFSETTIRRHLKSKGLFEEYQERQKNSSELI